MPNLPRSPLEVVTSRLAQNIARVGGAIQQMECLLGITEHSPQHSDWIEVQRLSDFVAASSESAGYPQVAEHARRVSQLAAHDETRPQAMEELIRLIGMCGQIQLADESPSTTSVKPLI